MKITNFLEFLKKFTNIVFWFTCGICVLSIVAAMANGREPPIENSIWLILSVALVGALVGFGYERALDDEKKDEQQRELEIKQSKEKEEKRLQAQITYSRNRIEGLTRLNTIIAESLEVSNKLPSFLKDAKNQLNIAEGAYNERKFVPFWEAIEKATKSIASFHNGIKQLLQLHNDFKLVFETYGKKGGIEPFPYPIKITDMTPVINLTKRLEAIVSKTHTDYEFSSIFLMYKTNSILVEGFTTFADTLDNIGSKISDSADKVVSVLKNVESTVKESGKKTRHAIYNVGYIILDALDEIAEQTSAYNENLEIQNMEMDNLLTQLSESANMERERLVLDVKRNDLLENIESGRTSNLLGFKPGTVKRK